MNRVVPVVKSVIEVVKASRGVRPRPDRAGSAPPVTPIPNRFRRRSMSGHTDGRVLGREREGA